MVDFEQRVILKPGKQREIIEEYVRLVGGLRKAARRLGIHRSTFFNYKIGKAKSLPLEIARKIAEEVGYDLNEITEGTATLKERTAMGFAKWREKHKGFWSYMLYLFNKHYRLRKRNDEESKELLLWVEKMIETIKKRGTLEDLLEGASSGDGLLRIISNNYDIFSKIFKIELGQEDFPLFLRIYFLIRDNPGMTERELGEKLGVPKEEVRRIIYKTNRFFVGKIKNGSESRWWVKRHLSSENLYKSSANLIYDKKLKSAIHEEIELRGIVRESI